MALRGEYYSNIGELVSQPDEIVPFAKVYIKEEGDPESDYISSFEEDMGEQQPNEAAPFSNNEKKPEVTRFLNNEWEIDRTIDKDENPLENVPNAPPFKSELQTNEHIFLSKNEDYDMKPCLEKNTESKEKIELLHEDVEVKVENEGEWENKSNIYSVNIYETASNSSRIIKQSLCNKLDQDTDYKTSHKQHQRKCSRQKLFACDQCDYRTTHNGHLNKHLMKHSGEKPLACSQCGYTTLYSNALKMHCMTHSGEKPFACDQCDYKSTCISNLKKHLVRRHSGEKSITCDQCDYKTNCFANLKKHHMKHSGEKPFACDQCNYKTRSSGDLKIHQMNHSSVKLLACNLCDYKTNYSGNLKQHQNKHSEKTSFTCNLCDYKCRYQRSLKRHQKKHL